MAYYAPAQRNKIPDGMTVSDWVTAQEETTRRMSQDLRRAHVLEARSTAPFIHAVYHLIHG